MSRFTLLPLLLLVLLGLGLTVPQTAHALAHTPTTVDRRSLAFAHPRRDAAVFNPMMKRTQPLEMEMTNGERMKRGMGPKKPHWKRQGALRPRASPMPGPQQQQGCTPRTGVLRVGDQGFLSRAANPFGEYLVTRDRADALTVVLGCDDRNLRSTNGFATFPLLGAIQGFSSDNAELRPNALNYLYVGGVAQTTPGATPAVVGNSFSTATGDAEASESAIWVVAQSGDVSVRWVNPDGSTPQTSIVYVGGRNVLSIVGDVAAFVGAVEDASVVTLRFEGTAP